MRVAIFSDVHGNKEALTSIIEDIKKENIDEIICLGDTIGIGPNPKECMDIIINNNITSVLGNHELYFINGADTYEELSEGEVNHQNWIKNQITDKQKEYINKCSLTLEKEYNGKKVLFEHFLIDYNLEDKFPFYNLDILKSNKVNEVIKSLDYSLIFIGHEHKDFSIDNKLYDVGSTGCRKDNITRYTILDTDTFNVETKLIEYTRDKFIKDLLEKDYPDREKIAQWLFGIEI